MHPRLFIKFCTITTGNQDHMYEYCRPCQKLAQLWSVFYIKDSLFMTREIQETIDDF